MLDLPIQTIKVGPGPEKNKNWKYIPTKQGGLIPCPGKIFLIWILKNLF